jgi:uncharacterized protein (TIGR03085 family)
MSRHDVAARERAGLLDRAEEAGADAPTLCEGWTVHHLLAHMWVREHDPTALPGLVIPAFHGHTAVREHAAFERFGFAELLGELRAGPPLLPFGLPGVREVGNVHEHFVHHEDIRRANGDRPRQPVDADLAEALWWRLRASALAMFRRVRGAGVVLRRPDGATVTARWGQPVVTITGEVPELFLYAFNRKGPAAVGLVGPERAVARVRESHLGP